MANIFTLAVIFYIIAILFNKQKLALIIAILTLVLFL